MHGIFVFTQTSCCCCRRRSSSHGQRSRYPVNCHRTQRLCRIRSPKPVSTERCNLLNLHDHVGRIRRLRRIRQSTAGGHKMAAFLLIHHQQMCLHNVTGRATVRQQISHCFKIWR
ncbi:hypothetical protein BU64_10540 [Escherichia coli O128:H2 str. 2011C-3317]|nr:hypothetical protein BU64_10540 [Escherichia coli O128:H2 str. 2011C-3317]